MVPLIGELLGEKIDWIKNIDDLKKLNFHPSHIKRMLDYIKDETIIQYRNMKHNCFSVEINVQVVYLERFSLGTYVIMYFCTRCFGRYAIHKDLNSSDYRGYDSRPTKEDRERMNKIKYDPSNYPRVSDIKRESILKEPPQCFICKKPKHSFIMIMKPRPEGGKMMHFEDVCKKHKRQWYKGKYKRIRRKAEKVWKHE